MLIGVNAVANEWLRHRQDDVVVGHPRKELAVLVPLVVLAIASQPERTSRKNTT